MRSLFSTQPLQLVVSSAEPIPRMQPRNLPFNWLLYRCDWGGWDFADRPILLESLTWLLHWRPFRCCVSSAYRSDTSRSQLRTTISNCIRDVANEEYLSLASPRRDMNMDAAHLGTHMMHIVSSHPVLTHAFAFFDLQSHVARSVIASSSYAAPLSGPSCPHRGDNGSLRPTLPYPFIRAGAQKHDYRSADSARYLI